MPRRRGMRASARLWREDRREGAVELVELQRARVAGTPMEPRFVNVIAALGEGTIAPVLMILGRG